MTFATQIYTYANLHYLVQILVVSCLEINMYVVTFFIGRGICIIVLYIVVLVFYISIMYAFYQGQKDEIK